MIAGSQPATAIARTRARGTRPRAVARSALMTSMAEAPSEMAEDEPAVTVPFFGSKAGGSAARPSRLVSGRMTSSTSHSISAPSAS